jgi:hypothetical protein
MASERKPTANQRNSTHSTGPRTEKGKAAIRFNALKHGLTAAQVLLPDEDEGEFGRHMDAIDQQLQPQGALEQSLSESIAMKLWRLRRVCRLETEVLRCQTREALSFHFDHEDPLGQAFINDCRSPEAILKLSRYETALHSQLLGCLREFRELSNRPVSGFVSRSEAATDPGKHDVDSRGENLRDDDATA